MLVLNAKAMWAQGVPYTGDDLINRDRDSGRHFLVTIPSTGTQPVFVNRLMAEQIIERGGEVRQAPKIYKEVPDVDFEED